MKTKAVKQMSGKRLFVVDTFCGANAATRMKVRFIMEVAWQAHFVTNMFIQPTEEEVNEEISKMAEAYKMEADKLKELLGERELEQMKKDMAVQKAVTVIADAAKEV